MPVNRKDYPENWDQISLEVKEAAEWKCEWCLAPHKAVIKRNKMYNGSGWSEVLQVYNGGAIEFRHSEPGHWEDTATMKWSRLRFHGLTRVILSTAHLDRNTQNNDRRNLAALCQRCHLNHDILQHVANRKYGRRHSADHQLKLN